MIFMDLETQSVADLTKVGGRAYAADPTTRILCACWYVDGIYRLWVPYEHTKIHFPLGIPEAPLEVTSGPDMPDIPTDVPWVAHNADEFDSLVWGRSGLLQPVRWIDSLPKARLAGLPGSLDALSEKFLGLGKNKIATNLVKAAQGHIDLPKPGHLSIIATYNVADVAALKEVWPHVQHYEDKDYPAHRACNSRGVRFDRGLAGTILRLSAENVSRAAAEIEAITGGAIRSGDLTKRQKIIAWCEAQGLRLTSLRRDVVQQLIDDPEEFLGVVTDDYEANEEEASPPLGGNPAESPAEPFLNG
jgi:hypothetical protein